MGLLDKVVKRARQGHQVEVLSLSGGSWGGFGSNRLWYQGEGIDYNKAAGDRYDNGIVYAIVSFLVTCLNEVPVVVMRGGANGTPKPVKDHLISNLLNKPNPWYDGTLLQSVQVMLESVRGNSFTYKHRAPWGEVIALEVIPEGMCIPYTWPGSGEWISEYRINTPSGMWRVPPCDVLHMRWATVWPRYPQLGMSPLEACLPDIVADQQAARHEASLLTNAGVTPIAACPKPPAGFTGTQALLKPEQREQLRDDVESAITGGNKGRPLIWSYPMEVERIAFSPEEIGVKSVRDLSEQRICSGFNVPPVIVGLGTGLDKQNNRASIQGAINIALNMCLIPYMKHRARQMTEDLVPELGRPGDVVEYDLSKMESYVQFITTRVMEASGGPVITPNEARKELGKPPVEGGNVLRSGPKGAAGGGAQGEGGSEAVDSTTEQVDGGGKPGDRHGANHSAVSGD